MKKFGTPIGAGPGRANEKVGLAGVGTPPLVAGGGGVGAIFLFGFCFFFFFLFLVGAAGGQDQETLVIGRLTGSGSELAEVPGATFWNVNVWPPCTVTTTVQPSAEASGSADSPSTTAMEAMVTAAMLSFRLVNTVACSSRGLPRAKSSQLRSQ